MSVVQKCPQIDEKYQTFFLYKFPNIVCSVRWTLAREKVGVENEFKTKISDDDKKFFDLSSFFIILDQRKKGTSLQFFRNSNLRFPKL